MKNKLPIVIAAIVIIIAIIAIVLLLPKNEYINNITSDELIKIGLNSFTTEGGTYENDEDKILDFTVNDTPELLDYKIIKANNAKNINEIGVFHIKDGKVNDFKHFVNEYVDNLKKSYKDMNYLPEETEKINCATVKVFGNYIVYSFLNENDTEAFYKSIESALIK